MNENKFKEFFGGVWGFRLLVLALICVFMLIVEPRFFQVRNITNLIEYISVYGIMSCGMLFTVLIGGLDLSIGRMAALSGTVTCVIAMSGSFSTGSQILGILGAIAVGALFGFLHGFLIVKVQMPAFVVTLATSYLIYGLIPVVANSSRAYIKDGTMLDKLSNLHLFEFHFQSGDALVLTLRSLIFIVFAIVCWFLLSKTTFGRRIYAIGGNPTAAKFVGIKVYLNTCIAYIISAVAACIGGMLLMSSAMYSSQTMAAGYEGTVLMALIVGGINLAGGKGNVSGAIFGALIVGIISSVINLTDFLNADYLKFFQGVIIILVITISTVIELRNRKGTGRKSKKVAEINAQVQE